MSGLRARAILLLGVVLMLIGCIDNLQGTKISEENMQKYIFALNSMHRKDPAMLGDLGALQLKEHSDNEQLDRIVDEAGFDNYEEFKAINGKVISIYYSLNEQMRYDARVEKIRAVQEQDEQRLDAYIKRPDISKEVRSQIQHQRERAAELHKQTLDRLRKERQASATFTENDKESVAVVKQYLHDLDKLLGHSTDQSQARAVEELKSELEEKSKAEFPKLNGEITIAPPAANE